jgi:hypothetical protein
VDALGDIAREFAEAHDPESGVLPFAALHLAYLRGERKKPPQRPRQMPADLADRIRALCDERAAVQAQAQDPD